LFILWSRNVVCRGSEILTLEKLHHIFLLINNLLKFPVEHGKNQEMLMFNSLAYLPFLKKLG
jgi:hypothetical protein